MFWTKIDTHKDWGLENNTNLNSIFCVMKSSAIIFIFLPAFYLIMWVSLPKDFEKILIFEYMTAVFLLRCQNLLRQINPKIM